MHPPTCDQTSEAGDLKELFSSLRDSVASSGGSGGRGRARHDLNGMFSRLTEPEQFRKVALARLPEEERRHAPSSLQVGSGPAGRVVFPSPSTLDVHILSKSRDVFFRVVSNLSSLILYTFPRVDVGLAPRCDSIPLDAVTAFHVGSGEFCVSSSGSSSR